MSLSYVNVSSTYTRQFYWYDSSVTIFIINVLNAKVSFYINKDIHDLSMLNIVEIQVNENASSLFLQLPDYKY